MNNIVYIVRNRVTWNTSILGVFESVYLAKKAIEEKRASWKQANVDAPNIEIKAVLLNGTDYIGCSAYSTQLLLECPDYFKELVEKWFNEKSDKQKIIKL